MNQFRQTTMDFMVRYSFSGHESFPFRYSWLPKGVQKSIECPDIFVRENAPVILGVGKNMVRSIRHWCTAMSLISSTRLGTVGVTELGRTLFAEDGLDPYMEDIGTLWVLHWLLVRNAELAATWYLAFTRFAHVSFRREQLVRYLLSIVEVESPTTRVTESSVKRDVDVFVRTYVPSRSGRSATAMEESYDCPLVELGIMREDDSGTLSFVVGPHPSLPDAVLAYAIIDYWDRERPDQLTLSFEEVMYGPGSPGAAFKLTENAFIERLERLPEWTGLRFDETAGRRMLIRAHDRSAGMSVSALSILRRYYETEGEC